MTWFIIAIYAVILPTFFFLAEENRTFQKWLNQHQNFCALSLNISSNVFLKGKNKFKWLMVIWIWAALIMSVKFQIALFGGFIKARYEKPIDTIEELKASGMKIYIHEFHANHENLTGRNFSLKDQYIISNVSENNRHLRNNEKGVYVVSQDIATMYINQFILSRGDPVYRIAKDTFVPGVRVFHMQKHSPFLRKVNEILLILEEFGLRKQKKYSISEEQFQKSKVLNFSHLSFVFTIHLYGNVVALLVFVCEILCKKINNYYDQCGKL